MRNVYVTICSLLLCTLSGPAVQAATQAERQAVHLSDAELTAALSKKIRDSKFIDTERIEIKVANGVASLVGKVGDLRSKGQAVRLAESMMGIRGVVDRLTVVPDVRTDKAIRNDVENALRLDPTTESYEVKVRVANGVVALSGQVDSWSERSLAQWVAEGVQGVRAVRNRLLIEENGKRSEKEMADDIRGQLRESPWIDFGDVGVVVRDREAVLTGFVGSRSQRQLAEALAWVSGIRSVDISGLYSRPRRGLAAESAVDLETPTDDLILKTVRQDLLLEPRLAAAPIKVRVESGVVFLSGAAANLAVKKEAARVAETVTGVKRVQNNVEVQKRLPRDSKEIASNVRTMLTLTANLEEEGISVSVNERVARLSGTVESAYQKWLAEDAASRVAGVARVENNLSVRSKERS